MHGPVSPIPPTYSSPRHPLDPSPLSHLACIGCPWPLRYLSHPTAVCLRPSLPVCSWFEAELPIVIYTTDNSAVTAGVAKVTTVKGDIELGQRKSQCTSPFPPHP
ncbi:hypothetical protein BOTBODRAFT_182008 [Botryobasidium botryosum FD-172 SS1]|uniref:Uncharacterized protein n=1 Tax=Botryobasidium botryosum (strain FD-172 SS1) TaxID=930990 RepID=A0A067LUQ4_BOTB1|nr:hypothetical protein BOTBODRAFT_182008 [Botryobasidium botryosum FD-172 SS1]